MGLLGLVSLGVFLTVGIEINGCDAFRVARQGNGLIIELLIVVDYSEFNKWYMRTSSSSSHTDRVNEARDNLKQYLAALIHSSNNVYKSLQSYNLNVQIKLVEVLIMMSASESPWTETLKRLDDDGVSYVVDPSDVLPLFKPKSEALQQAHPHDHAMLFTSYAMKHSTGGTFAGYAKTEAECTPRSISVVEDSDGLYTAQLMAHEIGHSIGCDHDGEGNSKACSSGIGYAMEAHFKLANEKKWRFSSCSAAAIKTYINYLNTHHENCLTHFDNSHPDSHLTTAQGEWYGQIYTWDEQCKINYGQQSYFCRGQYDGNYTRACLKMYCYNPAKDGCYYHDGGDGAPCGTGKWCMSNHCVSSSASQLQSLSDTCVAGDQPGVVYNGRTCKEIGQGHHTDCQRSSVKEKCCATCEAILGALPTLSSTDIDGQCVRKHGSGSYFCRGASTYSGKAYSDVVCSRMLCHDTTRDHWCLSSDADDFTSCGYKKWCKNGACVHDNSAPAVPDDCPWGDQSGVIDHGITCEQVKQPENNRRCYESYTAKRCCGTCKAIARSIKGCEYGDESSHCHASSCHSYDSTKLARCCSTCKGVAIIG